MLAFHHSGEDSKFDALVEWAEEVKRQFPTATYDPENYFILGEKPDGATAVCRSADFQRAAYGLL